MLDAINKYINISLKGINKGENKGNKYISIHIHVLRLLGEIGSK